MTGSWFYKCGTEIKKYNPDLLEVFWQLCRQLLSFVMVLHIQRYRMYRYLIRGRKMKT